MCDRKTTPKATLGVVPLTLHFEMTSLEGREDWGCQVGKLAWQLGIPNRNTNHMSVKNIGVYPVDTII